MHIQTATTSAPIYRPTSVRRAHTGSVPTETLAKAAARKAGTIDTRTARQTKLNERANFYAN